MALHMACTEGSWPAHGWNQACAEGIRFLEVYTKLFLAVLTVESKLCSQSFPSVLDLHTTVAQNCSRSCTFLYFKLYSRLTQVVLRCIGAGFRDLLNSFVPCSICCQPSSPACWALRGLAEYDPLVVAAV